MPGVPSHRIRLSFAGADQYNRSVFMGARWPIRGSVLAATFCLAFDAHPQSQPAAVLNQYCLTCHNERLKTGGLVLNPADLTAVPEHAETWEKVIRKLQSGAMPPPGMPKPDTPATAALLSFLETGLDRAAATNPRAGKTPLLHRLSRTEYENAI